MIRKEAINFLRNELCDYLSCTGDYILGEEENDNQCDAGLILFEKLEKMGMIRPPMTGDLKSQWKATHNRWDDEE